MSTQDTSTQSEDNSFVDEGRFVRYALDSAAIVAITDVQGTITFVNSKFCEISGFSRDELVGANHRMLRSGSHDTAYFRAMYRCIARGKVWHGEICNRRKDGSIYWVDTTIVPHVNILGKVDSYTSIRFDITNRREAEIRLHEAVNTDALTGIANRRRFQEYIETALVGGRSVYLALLDIDSFKEINDSYGHDVGDALLCVVGERLKTLATEGKFVARLGGDEFGIVMPDVELDEALAFMETVLADVRDPIQLGAAVCRCSASIGLAAFPRHGQTQEQLFKVADIALYQAKALGRDRFTLFTPELQEAVQRKAELLDAIEVGLAANQFCLHYQPIVDAFTGKATSLEALLRWQHPSRGLLTPGAFLPAVQEPGLQSEMSMLVIQRAFNDMATLMQAALPIRRVAINLTNADFRSERFVNRFFELSRQTGIPPSRFCVEVTEGVFLGRDFQKVERLLRRLQKADVEIALDDFGTGFASLTHLKQMSFDRIKIDRSFIANITTNASDLAIVRGVLDIAHSMGKTVTAEGVETREQAELLRDLGCDLLQGWYFAKACTIERLPWVLANLPALPLGTTCATRRPRQCEPIQHRDVC